MSRDDVVEFLRDGNNLVLKLKNGETIVIEGFFITYDNVSSDLVFEEDGCVLYWFDGVSGFKDILGLEVLLPEAGSKLGALLPWLVGAGVVGGAIVALDNDDKKDSIPNGTNIIEVKTAGTITGKTENVPEGTEVKITITGQDKDGKPLVDTTVTAIVQPDGSYTADVPADFADGELTVTAETVDRNARCRDRQACLQRDLARDIAAGGAFRRGATHDDVVHVSAINAGAQHGVLHGMAAQGGAMRHVERTLPALGERRAGGGNNHCGGHVNSFDSVDGCTRLFTGRPCLRRPAWPAAERASRTLRHPAGSWQNGPWPAPR